MMKKREITVYNISELSEKAFEKAYSDFCSNDYYPWFSENEATINAFCEIFPIKAKDWEYGYRNYVNCEFTEEAEIAELTGIRLLKYLVNNYWHILYPPKQYWICNGRVNCVGQNAKHRKSKVFCEPNCSLTGYCIDYDILEPLIDFIKKPNETDFEQLLYECLQSWVYACNKDFEYYYSEESFREIAELNDYEYDENGNMI